MSPGATTQSVLAIPTSGEPAEAVIATNVDMKSLLADVRDDGVAAPADQVAGLREVVAHAKADGYDVSFVVFGDPVKFTYYRDIATELQSQVGGTVIVLGPNSVGSASPYFSRVQQEEATQDLTLTNPPAAAQQMWDQMQEPSLNWTAITLVLIAVVVVGAVVARMRSLRKRSGSESVADASSQGADDLSASAAGPGTHDLSRDLP
ncbi:DUF6676 family protein [Gordonia sp. CPCC 206044]|uniref:Rv1476 family membrane protein n=1 Tax=Gordonia sp. CPCC 206044 TaxID=3140793 RepID=UPI003AF35166